MQVIRTIIWVLLFAALVFFSALNFTNVEITLWPNSDPAKTIVADTYIPVLVIVSFLVGFVPMWLYHRGARWTMQRKIANLENAARTAADTPVAAAPAPTPEPAPEPALGQEPVAAPDSDLTAEPTPADRDGDGKPDALEFDPPPASGTYRAPGE